MTDLCRALTASYGVYSRIRLFTNFNSGLPVCSRLSTCNEGKIMEDMVAVMSLTLHRAFSSFSPSRYEPLQFRLVGSLVFVRVL